MFPTPGKRTARIVAACAVFLAVCASGCSDEDGGSSGGGADLEAVRARLKDRLFEFGISSGNRDSNAFVTGVNQLQLCGIGLFALKEKTSFSSNVGSMQSEAMHYGTWKLVSAGGAAVVELTIERSSENNPPGSKQFRVEIAGDVVRFDGNATMGEADMTADCEVAAQERR
jgi:hypothetical protein